MFICPDYYCDNTTTPTFLKTLACLCVLPSINLSPHWGAKKIVYIEDVIRDCSCINASFGSVKSVHQNELLIWVVG